MSNGLWKIHHACLNQQAIADWNKLASLADSLGRHDLVEKYQYPEGAGWRKLDKYAKRLNAELKQLGADTGLDYCHVV